MKKNRIALFIGSLFLLLLLSLIFYENSYDMKESEIVIETKKGKLAGFIARPKKQTKGIVIFVHGDGGQNATQDGGYKPLMERFAKQGYTSISWSKPGIGGSEGNWLNQSMEDRSNEVLEVINWAEKIDYLNTKKIVLWGASQAGWVIPKVLAKNKEITGTILAAPAINWLRQGQYYTRKQMEHKGKTEQEISKRLAYEAKANQFIIAGASYKEYQKGFPDSDLAEERYYFIKKNMLEDAEKDLKQISVPCYLLMAEKDQNVDSQETKEVYQKLISNKKLHVQTISSVDHNMLNSAIQKSEFLISLSLILFPKDILISPAYLKACEDIVADL